MITPSILNPIHLFRQDQPIYWRNNQYGADRGYFIRDWPFNVTIPCYAISDQPMYLLSALKCSDSSVIAQYPVVNVTGNYWASYPYVTDTIPHYFMWHENTLKVLFSTGNLTVPLLVDAGSAQGSTILIKRAMRIEFMDVRIDFGVVSDITQTVDINFYRFNQDGTRTFIGTVGANWIGSTGVQTKTIQLPPTAQFPWGAGDRITWTIRTRGSDSLSLFYTQTLAQVIDYYRTVETLSIFYEDYISNVEVVLRGYEAVYSELIKNFSSSPGKLSALTQFKYSNNKNYASVIADTEIINLLPVSFWQEEHPQENEDIEIAPGEFVRVRSEINRAMRLETDFIPGYLHEKIQTILGLDVVKINEVEYIQRSAYSFTNSRHYQLSKGSVMLTERKSISKNVI